jgi:hypothetical protein
MTEEKGEKREKGDKKSIYVMCKHCGKRIRIILDRDLQFSQDDQLYHVVHAHGELGEDPHALIIEIDHNLNVRNLRVSDKLFFTFEV